MIGNRLKQIRENLNLNKSEFAKTLNVPYTTYNNYETETREPSSDFYTIISNKLNISIDYLMGLTDEPEIRHSHLLKKDEISHIEKYRTLTAQDKSIIDTLLSRLDTQIEIKEESARYDTREITYFDGCVSAGLGKLALDNPPSRMLNISNLPEYARANYAVDMSGDSMEPTYQDGAILLVEITNEVSIGEVGIFLVDGEFFCKELGKGKLISHNDKYKPISLTVDSRCMGRVVGVWEE